MKKIAVIMHDGVEEGEAVITIDLLRRAGIQVDLYSLNNLEVYTSHNLKIATEKLLGDLRVENYDGIVYPGGPGVEKLLEVPEVVSLAKQFFEKEKLVAAICAAPQILGKASLLKKFKVTHFPGANQFMDEALEDLTKPVIVEKNIITSKGLGTAILFGLAIVEYLLGAKVRQELAKQIIFLDN